MTSKSNAEKKLQQIVSDNPDPNKWSVAIKIIIAILSAILGIIAENQADIVNLVSNLF